MKWQNIETKYFLKLGTCHEDIKNLFVHMHFPQDYTVSEQWSHKCYSIDGNKYS